MNLIKRILLEDIYGISVYESIEQYNCVEKLYNILGLNTINEALLTGEPMTIEELRNLLRKKVVAFKFIKLDNSIRGALGTLMLKYVPKTQHPKGIRPSSPKVATFYDLVKKDWRCVSNKSKEIVLQKNEKGEKPVVIVKDKAKVKDIEAEEKEKKSYEEKLEQDKAIKVLKGVGLQLISTQKQLDNGTLMFKDPQGKVNGILSDVFYSLTRSGYVRKHYTTGEKSKTPGIQTRYQLNPKSEEGEQISRKLLPGNYIEMAEIIKRNVLKNRIEKPIKPEEPQNIGATPKKEDLNK